MSRNTIAVMLGSLCLAALATLAACAAAQPTPPPSRGSGPQFINPGELWPDDRGQHVQAHGGGIIKYQGLYYWFGEQRGQDIPPGQRAVSCYSSPDLVHWTFRRNVLTMTPADRPADLPGTGIVLERPKVFYNAKTRQFVMYVHLDDSGYRAAEVGVATSATVDGDYKLLKHFRPLGQQSRDIGQFIDDDGTAYLIFEDRPNGWHIAKLSDDYLSIERDVHLFPEHMEGGALVHLDGLYYAIGSHLTGWNANPNLYATAKSLEGPWSEFRDIAPPASKTYGSQSTMLIKVVGTRSTTVIFMGDIWRPHTQWDSRYLWMPLEIADGKLVLPEPRQWTLDIATGEAVINKEAPAMVLPPPAPRRGPGGGTAPAPTSAPAANP